MTILPLLSDLLLLLATGGIGAYCWMLSGRLRALDKLEGKPAAAPEDDDAVQALSARVAALQTDLAQAQEQADDKADQLRDAIAAADDRIGRLELLLAGMEDIEADLEAQLDTPDPEPPEIVPTFRATRPKPERSLAR
ncbi:hypothetical protein [Jannaschia seohaensis]|uniref:Uncharacterized protein n=1 Tax=Jannaschia seohaensis TaxID=475081 RepID=A0A2Y9ASW6_9RHOB|nr:hypothetical protein [Jannaschia seohaensis]PWJ17411.1 hypothetical protein BCF38_10621 [Jannaschia seohaensis]SSA47474.1 hypothetical protein SAMN05421539_10621 [Jannaschia seohaensis]